MTQDLERIAELEEALQDTSLSAAQRRKLQEELKALQPSVVETENSVSPSTSGKSLPKEKEAIGILLSVEKIESDKGDFVLLSIQDKDDEIITIASSEAYWSKIGKFLKEDSIVKASYEVRRKGVTGYEAADGSWVTHSSDGNNLTRISRFSEKSFERMQSQLTREADLEAIQSVELERVSAVADYLKGTFR